MQHVIYFGTFSFLPITVTSCILLWAVIYDILSASTDFV
jgi:hypothetical protein